MLEVVQGALIWTGRQIWLALPLIVTAGVMVALMVPVNAFKELFPAPDIALIAIFFWAIHGPNFMPPWAVFLIGLGQDVLSGLPTGFSALVYLCAYGFTLSQRVFFKGRTGIGVWFSFALLCALTTAVSWVLALFIFQRWLDPQDALMQAGVSILLYPVFSRAFQWVRRLMTSAPDTV